MTKGDKILIIVVMLATAFIWGGLRYLPRKTEDLVAVVTVKGEEMAKLALDGETLAQTIIKIPRGEATLEYGQGKVRVLPLDHDTCPNEVCWRTGWISIPGQSIVCVPNRMVITLQGVAPEVDSIVR